MKTSIVPKGTRILVKQDILEETYGESKLIVQREHGAAEQAKINTGRLVAVGDDCWDQYESTWAKIGDKIVFGEYAGRTIIDHKNQEAFLVMNDTDIIAVIDETE